MSDMTTYHERNRWVTPSEDVGSSGILLADRIFFYVHAARLIDPSDFQLDGLRPASYDVHVGDHYYVEDKRYNLEDKGKFEIPSNGLAYIATKERFNIPYYIVAKYSLTVTQVYRGLLIDNGLQIDPGFCGQIHVPVHNFTDQPRSIIRGEPFLSMDFTMTTALPSNLSQISSESVLIEQAARGRLIGFGGQPIKLFYTSLKARNTQKTPEDFWNKYPGEKHESSLLALSNRVETRLSRLKWAGIIGAATTFIGFAIGVFPWCVQLYMDYHKAVIALEQKVANIEEDLKKQKESSNTSLNPSADSKASQKKEGVVARTDSNK